MPNNCYKAKHSCTAVSQLDLGEIFAVALIGLARLPVVHSALCCRVELCSSSGDVLKNFGLDECEGAPHEFRGVKRSTLLEALQKVVPSECVQYNAPIHSVEADQNGTFPTQQCQSMLNACPAFLKYACRMDHLAFVALCGCFLGLFPVNRWRAYNIKPSMAAKSTNMPWQHSYVLS